MCLPLSGTDGLHAVEFRKPARKVKENKIKEKYLKELLSDQSCRIIQQIILTRVNQDVTKQKKIHWCDFTVLEREGEEDSVPPASLLLCQHTSAAEEMGHWSRDEYLKPWGLLCTAWLTTTVCCERGNWTDNINPDSFYVYLLFGWVCAFP